MLRRKSPNESWSTAMIFLFCNIALYSGRIERKSTDIKRGAAIIAHIAIWVFDCWREISSQFGAASNRRRIELPAHSSAQSFRWSACQDHSSGQGQHWEWYNLGCCRSNRVCSRAKPTSLGCHRSCATSYNARWLMKSWAKMELNLWKMGNKLKNIFSLRWFLHKSDTLAMSSCWVKHFKLLLAFVLSF